MRDTHALVIPLRPRPGSAVDKHFYGFRRQKSSWPAYSVGGLRTLLQCGRRAVTMLLTALLIPHLNGCALSNPPTVEATGGFSFALVGDYNYGPIDGPEWQRSEAMLRSVNQAAVRFVIHLGDIQSGRVPCTDEAVAQTQAQFARFNAPVIYLPGDNEWTDCHRHAGKTQDPRFADPADRLNHLRAVFHSSGAAENQARLKLERQSALTARPEFRPFAENLRWQSGEIAFIGANVPGSNNNYSGGPESPQKTRVTSQDAEWSIRTGAVIEWLEDSFRWAKSQRARAVVIAWHGNPDFEDEHPDLPDYDSNGFAPLRAALLKAASEFPGPVLLAHGDSHTGLRIDFPLPLSNFTRVENFGHPHTHWTRISVNPRASSDKLFAIEPVRVP